jgi:hypothetical protein
MTAQKILICLHDFSRGGTERIAIGLAASWAGAGRDVTILCGTQEGGLSGTVDARVKVVTLEPPIARAFLSRFRLARAMARQLSVLKPDVIFLPGNFHLLLSGALRRADPRAVIVLKISNPPLPGVLSSWPGRVLFRHFTRSIDGFAALTAGFAREVAVLAPGKPAPVLHDPIYLRPESQSPPPPQGKFHPGRRHLARKDRCDDRATGPFRSRHPYWLCGQYRSLLGAGRRSSDDIALRGPARGGRRGPGAWRAGGQH